MKTTIFTVRSGIPFSRRLVVEGCQIILPVAIAFGLFAPQVVRAVGFRLPSQDAEAMSRGNAFVATADNPSALYYNPAGITQLPGHNVQIGAQNYFGLISQYESPAGSSSETDFEVVPVPQLYYTWSPKKAPVTLGLGVYAPFGLGLEWPEDTGFRTIAIEGRLTYITLNPVIAWKVCDQFSVAIGPNVNYSELKLRSGLLSPVSGGDEFEFKGDNFGYGFNAGLLWQPHPKWSFGANYRSASSVDYQGTTKISSPLLPSGKVDSSAEVDFPQIISGGVSFRPTPRWNIEANIDWTDWNTLNTVEFTRSSIGPIPFALNWRGSWFYEVGATHYFPSGFFLGLGYFFSSNSTSEHDFNPIVPDTDMHVGSIGGGYKGQHWRWGLAAQLISGPTRTIDTSKTSLGGQSPNGDYQWIIPSLNVSVGYHF